MTLLYSLPCAKMFQSKHELSLLFRAPPDRWLMFTHQGEVSSGWSETNGVKIGESESPRYCSQRPLAMSGSFPVSAQHTCSDTCTQILAHCAAVAVNKHTVTFTMAVSLASCDWIFLFFLLHNKVHERWLRITNSSKLVSFKQLFWKRFICVCSVKVYYTQILHWYENDPVSVSLQPQNSL